MTTQSPITNHESQIAPAEWFANIQAQAKSAYEQLPTPTRKDETWRFGNIKQLDFDGYTPEPLLELEILSPELPEGVICMKISEAIQQHGELVQKYFMRNESQLGSAKYSALHKAEMKDGLFVFVPDYTEVSEPIKVNHVVSGNQIMTFPHTLIITGKNATVSVLDHFTSENADDSAVCIAVNDLIAGEGSRLTYCAVQELNDMSRIIQVNETTAARDASAKAFTLNTGSQWARNESISKLEGEGAHSDMLSCSVASGTQEYDQRTYQHHAAPHTNSDLLYKNTLYGNSKTVFSGLILVDEGAHYTDAYQTCRNLLMEDTAEANSMPGLEINADQVKCSHGSTSSTISDEEIFYLRARGIQPNIARQMIAHGFSAEVVAKIENDTLEQTVLEAVERKFSQI